MFSRIHSFKPLLNRCLVKRIVPQSVTKGGIILSDKAAGKDGRFGEVIAVGPGDRDNQGNLIPTSIKAGDFVLLPDYNGSKVNMEDTENEYIIYRDTEILGVVEGFKH